MESDGVRPNDVFLYCALGFVAGAVAGGLGMSPLYCLGATAVGVGFGIAYRAPKALLFAAALCFVASNTYYAIDDFSYRASIRAVENAEQFEGVVIDVPRRGVEYQTVTLRLTSHEARIFVRTELQPPLSYGDVLRVSGRIVPPPSDSYGRYMAKERVAGSAFFPHIELLGHNESIVLGRLFGLREYAKNTLQKQFSPREAAFLSGILLGDRDGLTKEFLQKLSVSGTMHLTALSGLHMAIIIFLVMAVFRAALPEKPRAQFASTFALVALFVAMTGFAVSAIRASVMAFLAGFAKSSARVYTPRNAILFSALVLTLWNPKSPVFDIGFQLSFAAVISIIYLVPVLKRHTFFATPGVLGWRDVLAVTLAAQVGVLPITIANFANFSLSAFPANIAILVIMPPLMALGFLTILLEAFAPTLAAVLAIPTGILVEYAIFIVNTFAALPIMFNPQIGIIGACLFYGVLAWVAWRFRPSVLPTSLEQTRSKSI